LCHPLCFPTAQIDCAFEDREFEKLMGKLDVFQHITTDVLHQMDEGIMKMVFKLTYDLAHPGGRIELAKRWVLLAPGIGFLGLCMCAVHMSVDTPQCVRL
jgi:hypothetical protein